jgi:uncharacterized membrane-anchored protein YjiN (DUF445 family)
VVHRAQGRPPEPVGRLTSPGQPVRRTRPAPGGSPSEQRRGAQLVVAKRRATGLLAGVTAVFVVSTVLIHHGAWLAWVQATAVASMVGGLADWFAVTALFRRPLGLPIPHTAIVVERKDRFAETLGSFVQESFLSPDAVVDRLRTAGAVDRVALWLATPANAAGLAAQAADAVVGMADLLRDDDVHEVLMDFLHARLDRVALAPLAGRLLGRLTRDGLHQPTVDAALAGLGRALRERGPELHRRLGDRSPWWLPGPVEDRIVSRMLDRTSTVLAEMAADRTHPLRHQLDEGLIALARNLETSPDLRRRGEELKAELLSQPEVRALAATLWADTKQQLRAQAADPESELRRRLAAAIAHGGSRLHDDPRLAATAQRSVEMTARTVLGRFATELAGLVSGTFARWNAEDTSRRLELLLGPDLQYIRINGTLVGALAGLSLHLVSRVLS